MRNQISIIVPCFNQAQFLNECLSSSKNQTYSNWECIIINDGSLDDTAHIALNWGKKDSRFKYFYQENQGLAAARNTGLSRASGKYIQFLDADDFIDKFKLEKAFYLFQDRNIDAVISNFSMFDNLTKKFDPPFCSLSKELFNVEETLYNWGSKFSIPIHCLIIKIGIIKDFKFPEELKAREDWFLWLYIFSRKIKIYFADENLAFYRTHQNNMSKDEEQMNGAVIKSLELLNDFLPKKLCIPYYLKVINEQHKQIQNITNSINNLRNKKSYKLIDKLITNHFIVGMYKFLKRM